MDLGNHRSICVGPIPKPTDWIPPFLCFIFLFTSLHISRVACWTTSPFWTQDQIKRCVNSWHVSGNCSNWFLPKIEGSTPTPMMALSVGICVPDSSFIMNWNGSNGYLSSNRPIEIFAEVKLVTGPRPTTPGSLPRQILLTMATWWEMSQPTIGVNQPKNLDEATKSETQLTQKTIPTTLTAETQQIVSSKKVVGSSWISWYSRPGCRYLK